MDTGLLAELAIPVATLVVPAAIVTLLALVCVHRGVPHLFLLLVLLATCLAAVVFALAMPSLQSHRPGTSLWLEFLRALLALAPVFLVPAALVRIYIARPRSRIGIPILAILGAILSLPIGFI